MKQENLFATVVLMEAIAQIQISRLQLNVLQVITLLQET